MCAVGVSLTDNAMLVSLGTARRHSPSSHFSVRLTQQINYWDLRNIIQRRR